MKTKTERTVYEISVDDSQRVAREVLGRELSGKEAAAVGNSVGDYIDWFQASRMQSTIVFVRSSARR
jgi:hypothetical protein